MSSDSKKPTGKTFRLTWRKAVLAVLVVFVAWHIWPLVNPRWEQDRCSFGTVTNAQYREMKRQMGPVLDRMDKARSSKGYRGFEALLSETVIEELSKHDRMDEKIAKMHALMRSLGAHFTRQILLVYDPEDELETNYSSYRYGLITAKVFSTSWRSILKGILLHWPPSRVGIRFDADQNGRFTNPSDAYIVYGDTTNFFPVSLNYSHRHPCPAAPYDSPRASEKTKTLIDKYYKHLRNLP